MKLLVESSKRFLCGEDLNRLETSFVKTSIKDSSFISFLFPKDCLNILILPLLPFIPDPIKLSKGQFYWMKMEWVNGMEWDFWVKMVVIEGLQFMDWQASDIECDWGHHQHKKVRGDPNPTFLDGLISFSTHLLREPIQSAGWIWQEQGSWLQTEKQTNRQIDKQKNRQTDK